MIEQFTMSQFRSKEDLLQAKVDYYEPLIDKLHHSICYYESLVRSLCTSINKQEYEDLSLLANKILEALNNDTN